MTILDALLYFFIAIVGIQFIYYIIIFSRFAFAKETCPTQKNIAVSVVVCAKNETKNLAILIPKLIEQDYAQFEIVLINDASSDNSLEIMKSFESKHPNIKVVDVKNNEAFWGNKKYALTLGIKAASHDFLLLTDADCIPKTKQWIASMSSHFSNKKSIIIGYGAYAKHKKSFLNKLIRFETLLTAIQYFSYAKIGLPYMAVGRNLAYRKEVFYNVNGFMSHMNIRSGDDDLFVNQTANQHNNSICFSSDSFTISQPESSFKSWLSQKRRHLSTAKYYKSKHKIFLGLFYLTQICFWITAIILLAFLFKPFIVLSIIIFRLIFQYVIIGASAKKLDECDTLLFLPFLEFFLIISQFSIFISNLISKPKHWR